MDQLLELLRRPPRASKVASIQAAEQFKKLHAKATKYAKGRKQTHTQTQSLISELQEFQ